MTAVAELIAEVHAAGGSIERQGSGIRLAAKNPLPASLVDRVREAKPALVAYLHEPVIEPVLLADGRRLHRFRSTTIPAQPPQHSLTELPRRLRAYGVELVDDGNVLILIEPWLSDLPLELLQEARSAAGEIIALLRESRERTKTPR